MVRTLLIRGMLVGLLAGLLVFGFGRVVGEPQVDRAINFERAIDELKIQADAAKGIHDEEQLELVSRPVQAGFGLFTGVMVYSTAFGGLFALVFAASNGRAAKLGPRATSAVLAGCGFVAVYIVPNLKYPANPPSVGQPDTIGQRTELYFLMLALSVGAMVIAAMLRKRVVVRFGAWNSAILSAAVYLALVITVAVTLPVINEVPAAFPAVLLWKFRIASLGMQAILWAMLGLAFGAIAGQPLRSLRRFQHRAMPARRGSMSRSSAASAHHLAETIERVQAASGPRQERPRWCNQPHPAEALALPPALPGPTCLTDRGFRHCCVSSLGRQRGRARCGLPTLVVSATCVP